MHAQPPQERRANRAPAPAVHARVTAWIFWAIFLGNAAIIVVLWARGGNVDGVHTMGEALASVGRITGLLGAYLLLVQVLLLVRLPPLERLVGFDRLTVWHRRNGKLCISLVLAHVVFITLGYALTDRLSVSQEAWTLLRSYPGMVEATIGTAFLILVVLSSLIVVRCRLRYEAWYLVHLTAYAGIVLGWFHQIPTGNELVTNPRAAAYWTALYLASLALLVLFRFAQPLLRAWWHRLRVAEVTVEGPNVVSLRITGRHLDRLGAQAGQFFLWRFLTRDRWWEAHPFSLSAAPDGKSLRITVKQVGDFTRSLGALPVGTPVVTEGPFGVFTDAVRKRESVLLIAGGIGITPIRALVEEMEGDIVLIHRVMREEDLIFRDELEALARARGIRLCPVVGDHAIPGNEHLLSAEHLHRLISDLPKREVYLCGPPAMAHHIEQQVRQAGVPSRSIHVERFAL